MALYRVGDRVLFQGSQGVKGAQGAITSQQGEIVSITGTSAQVRWLDTMNGWHRMSVESLANLVRVEDLVPQNEPARAPRVPTKGAPHAL